MKPIRHAELPKCHELTLCGFAIDVCFMDNDKHKDVLVVAKDNETVTCPECAAVILEIRKMRIGRGVFAKIV